MLPIGPREQAIRERRWTFALLGLRVVALVVVISGVPSFPSAAANRFHEIASMPGVPYRDFAIEYPPGELLLAEAVGVASPGAARVLLALLAFVADLAAAVALRAGWGMRAMLRYLALGAPLLFFVYRRVDLVAVALAVWGIVLSRREQRSGGIALGAAVFTRLWPLVILPLLAIERRTRPIRALIVTVVAGVAGWLAVGGPSALREVLTFRGARGWEVESTVGVVVWTLTGERRFEQGAFRTGVVPSWARLALLALLIGGLAVLWWRARSYPGDLAGAPALVAVAILLVLSPLFSPQYVIWLLPWGALAAMDDRRYLWLAAVPLAITGGVMAVWYLDLADGHPGWSQVALMLRNLATLLIPVVWFAGSVSLGVARRAPDLISGGMRSGR